MLKFKDLIHSEKVNSSSTIYKFTIPLDSVNYQVEIPQNFYTITNYPNLDSPQ